MATEERPVRILSIFNKTVAFQKDAFRSLLDQNGITPEVPLTVVGVIGGPDCGKSFLANVLLTYFRNSGDGGWLNDFVGKPGNGRREIGFEMHGERAEDEEVFNPGIYAWSKIFRFKKEEEEEETAVLVLDLLTSCEEDYDVLEKLLLLWCSAVVDVRKEISVNLLRSIADLESFRAYLLASHLESSSVNISSQLNFVIRDFEGPVRNSEKVRELFVQTVENLPLFITEPLKDVMDRMFKNEACNVVFLSPAAKEIVVEKNEKISVDAKLCNQLKRLAEAIVESLQPSEIPELSEGFEKAVDFMTVFEMHLEKTCARQRQQSLPPITAEDHVGSEGNNNGLKNDATPASQTACEFNHHTPSSPPPQPLVHGKVSRQEIEEKYPEWNRQGDVSRDLFDISSSAASSFDSTSPCAAGEGSVAKSGNSEGTEGWSLEQPQSRSAYFSKDEASSAHHCDKMDTHQEPKSSCNQENAAQSPSVPDVPCIDLASPDRDQEMKDLSGETESENVNQVAEPPSSLDQNPQEDIELWMEVVSNLYQDQMHRHFKREFQRKYFIAKEDFEKGHHLCFNIVAKDLKQLPKNMDITIPSNVTKKAGSNEEIVRLALERTESYEKCSSWIIDENRKRQHLLQQSGGFLKSDWQRICENWAVQRSVSLCQWKEPFIETLTNHIQNFAVSLQAPSVVLPLLKEKLMKDPELDNSLSAFGSVQEILSKYEEEMLKKFKMSRSFVNEKLQKQHERCLLAADPERQFNTLPPWAIQTLNTGISSYFEQFQKLNNAIQDNELKFIELLIPTTVDLYAKSMTSSLKDNPLDPRELEDVNRIVAEKVISFALKTCDFKPPQELDSRLSQKLASAISTRFPTFANSNRLAHAKAKEQLKAVLRESRSKYNSEMEAAFPRRGRSVDEFFLKKKHEEVQTRLSGLLEAEIIKFKGTLSPQPYLEDFRNEVAKDFEEFKQQNLRSRKREQEEQETKMCEAKKAEALRKEKEEEDARRDEKLARERNRKQSEVTERRPEVTHIQKKADASYFENPPEKVKKEPRGDLPPIVVEFGFQSIQVGYLSADGLEIIYSDLPPLFSINEKGHVYLCDKSQNAYSVAQALTTPSTTWSLELPSGVQEVPSTVMIGLFLAELKRDVEGILDGIWSKVIFTVPLCLRSVQRLMIENAAKLAGFLETFLLNNTAAAALFLANEPRHFESNERNAVVIAVTGYDENNDLYFDIANYSYLGGKVKMESSCGNRHATNVPAKQGGVLDYIASVPGRVLKFFTTRKASAETESLKKVIKAVVQPESASSLNHVIFLNTANNDCISVIKFIESAATNARPYNITGRCPVLEGGIIYAQKYQFGRKLQSKEGAVQDKHSYDFYRSTIVRGERSETRYRELKGLPSEHCDTLGVQSNEFRITEKGMEEPFPVGEISFPSETQSRTPVNLSLALDAQGILRVKDLLLASGRSPISYQWKSDNLTPEEVNHWRRFLSSCVKDEEGEAMEEVRGKLMQLLQTANKSKVEGLSSMFGKKLLKAAVEEGQKLLASTETKRVDLKRKLEYIQGLCSKYIK